MTATPEPAQNLIDRDRLNDVNLANQDGHNSFIDQGFTWLVQGFAMSVVIVLGWMSWVIFRQAQPAIEKFGFGFLWTQNWDINELTFGALPYIYGTLVSSAIALIIALPIGLAVAVVTSERFLPPWIRSPIAFVVELIAAIPSVIIGLWGIFVLIPFLQPVQQWLFQHLSWIPIFNSEPAGPSMLIAGIILAIMILPTIAAISREVLIAIPKELRTASASLGATQWETIFRVLLPSAISGILGAAMLGLGRALGETMAVTMVIGNSDQISTSLLNPGNTIPALLANQFAEASDGLHIGALMYLALILFALTLIVNMLAIVLVKFLKPGEA
ncbi:MAG: phosphate ABC transporter permease subunit PstC [Candidatus Parcubacteria bacterium]|uniref:phosphate ABC transporter permease subunit PstC n=1 Tax=Phormidesmis priestleyi TaxID=268141 RepID=UPI00083AF0D8|nr:phosphate ABC transporter permease subunit PstC [Phormidesmis priestleyi]MBC7824974.1 phosphate ABC transporter permease subunit PstC [Leptolyngbyaceae cyanobacterium LF-bin-113]